MTCFMTVQAKAFSIMSLQLFRRHLRSTVALWASIVILFPLDSGTLRDQKQFSGYLITGLLSWLGRVISFVLGSRIKLMFLQMFISTSVIRTFVVLIIIEGVFSLLFGVVSFSMHMFAFGFIWTQFQ